MNLSLHTITVGLGMLIAAPVFASTINVDFGKPDAGFNQSVSTTATYTFAPGFQILATGYHINSNSTLSSTSLYAKTAGGDEEGLGLAANGGADHEITPGNLIQLDLTKVTQFGAISFTVKTNSTTGSDAFSFYTASTAGTLGSFYTSGNTETTYSFTAAQIAATPYINLRATAGDVLLGPGTINSTAAPEPGTMMSLGAGLILVGVGFKKKFRG